MRMPRYTISNDGVGPYAIFYCEKCSREFRSQPDVGNTIQQSVGRAALGGFLRNIPIVGYAAANSVQDTQYSTHLSPEQLNKAWEQVQEHFHECPTCQMVVCPSDWDAQADTCTEDSPRRAEIAQAQAEQAAGIAKGFASAFGIGAAVNNLSQAARNATATMPRCSKCGTPARPGTKFCPQCGGEVVAPTPLICPKCQTANAPGAAFCSSCGTALPKPEEAAATATKTCPKCGSQVSGSFCSSCGTQVS